jgi:hypothetical protein
MTYARTYETLQERQTEPRTVHGLAIFLVVWYVLSFTPTGQKALVIAYAATNGTVDPTARNRFFKRRRTA